MRIKASKGFMLKGSPYTTRDSRCSKLVQREKGRYAFNPRSALRNGLSSCLEAAAQSNKRANKRRVNKKQSCPSNKTQQERNYTPLTSYQSSSKTSKQQQPKHFRSNQSWMEINKPWLCCFRCSRSSKRLLMNTRRTKMANRRLW